MSEHSINHLGVIADKILEVQRTFMKEVMNALNHLKLLPDYIKEIRNDMNTGITRVIQSKAEMEIYIRMAQMSSKKILLNSENEAIAEFKDQLKYDFNEIDNRYSKIQNELNDECKKRIREIDEYLFAIPEKFPMNLYLNFSNEVMPLFQNLLSDSQISHEERIKAISVAVNKSRDMINSFIKIRNDFMKDVKDFQFGDSGEEPAMYYVPVWLAEKEDLKEGTVTTEAYLPGQLIMNSDILEMDKIKMVPEKALGPYQQILNEKRLQEFLIKSVKWGENEKYKDELMQNFEKYFDGKYQGKYSGVKKAVIKSIDGASVKFINQN